MTKVPYILLDSRRSLGKWSHTGTDQADPTDETMVTFKYATGRASDEKIIIVWNTTHLWSLLRTHGKALRALTITAKFVSTPMMRTASWITSSLRNFCTTLKRSQRTPERAQPLWIPPRCWLIISWNHKNYSHFKNHAHLNNGRTTKAKPEGGHYRRSWTRLTEWPITVQLTLAKKV